MIYPDALGSTPHQIESNLSIRAQGIKPSAFHLSVARSKPEATSRNSLSKNSLSRKDACIVLDFLWAIQISWVSLANLDTHFYV
jgi:hypothetical protein